MTLWTAYWGLPTSLLTALTKSSRVTVFFTAWERFVTGFYIQKQIKIRVFNFHEQMNLFNYFRRFFLNFCGELRSKHTKTCTGNRIFQSQCLEHWNHHEITRERTAMRIQKERRGNSSIASGALWTMGNWYISFRRDRSSKSFTKRCTVVFKRMYWNFIERICAIFGWNMMERRVDSSNRSFAIDFEKMLPIYRKLISIPSNIIFAKDIKSLSY